MDSPYERLEAAVREKRRLEEQLRQLNDLIAELEQEVLEAMASAGIQQAATPTATLYIAVDRWARPAPGREDELAEALEQHGMGDLARRRVLPQQLSAVVREWLDHGESIPDWLSGLVTYTEVPRVRVRAR